MKNLFLGARGAAASSRVAAETRCARFVGGVTALVCLSGLAFAVKTKTWTQADLADFQKGTLKHLSLSSEGKLTVAPAVKEIFDASTAFLWAVARDSKGNLYTGGGGLGSAKAKLFEIDSQGRAKPLTELDGIAIQAIAVDKSDRVYAATSPDGKVYRVDASGKADVFYDPKAKYIWALAFDAGGNLYVATGDEGEIHRVTPAGQGAVFFKTEEAHARSLTVDKNGNLIVGTDPSGLILRISPAGQGFVLYQAPKREITAVAVAPDGTIYAAGVGNKQAAPTPAPAPAQPAPAGGAAAGGLPSAITVTGTGRGNPATTVTAARQNITGGSDVYRVQADGYARKIWSHTQELAYALAFDARGRAIVGTGNHGYLYRIDSDHAYTQLVTLESTQITGLSAAADGTLYAVTGNIGKMFSIGPGAEASGTIESDVFDAGSFTYWGRVTGEPERQSGVVLETRSGNLNRPQQNWSPWEKLNAGRSTSPAARFIQYRATLTGNAELEEVELAYQMKNVAPVIEELEITPVNYKFPAPSAAASSGSTNPTTLTLPALGRKPAASSSSSSASGSGTTPTMNWAKGDVGARWLASDENNDTLQFKVEIRGASETEWKLIRDKIREHYLSWDSSAYPDGKYFLRVTASDAPSNPPDQALVSSRESDSFWIDNTPPEITGLAATTSAGKLEVRFHAKDTLSTLGTAEYSVNGGEWTVAEPTTRLTDSEEHDYRVTIDKPQGEATIAVRVSDDFENQAVAKTVVK